jgi:hypothetical protein
MLCQFCGTENAVYHVEFMGDDFSSCKDCMLMEPELLYVGPACDNCGGTHAYYREEHPDGNIVFHFCAKCTTLDDSQEPDIDEVETPVYNEPIEDLPF